MLNKYQMKLPVYICLCFLPMAALAQKKGVTETPTYPQEYFRNPLDIPIFMAGNFGECRPGHFHSGVDIKTLGKENQPVHAAGDGYISRIKMEKGGFGHGIYITHPNGYTTLYAHLNNFAPSIQKYVHGEQYAKKRWDVDLQLPADKFPVKKGQMIAYSGNTGASTAPHLHFEIRDTKSEHPLNPELFGLPVIDKLPPVPSEVYFYEGKSYNIGIEKGFYEKATGSIELQKKGDTYKVAKGGIINKFCKLRGDTVILNTESFGVGINVEDYMDGSENTLTFYTAKLYLDDKLQSQVTLDNIGYDVSRYIHAYADYKTRQTQHKWVQCLFKLPGNKLDGIFTYLNEGNGFLYLNSANRLNAKVKIVITDDKGNDARVEFVVKTDIPVGNASMEIPVNPGLTQFNYNQTNDFEDASARFALDENQLYDNILFSYKTTPDTSVLSNRCSLHYPYVPLHHYFDLNIKPIKSIPDDMKDKVVMMYTDGKDEDGRAAKPADNGWYKASVRNFGTYWLDIDNTPPVIKPLQKNGAVPSKASQISFEVKDDVTSVKIYSGYIDGKWVCFEQHANLFFYKFDEYCPKGRHELEFKAVDENGNQSTVHFKFTR